MARETIDLRVSMFAGSVASIGELMMFVQVRGGVTGGGEYLVVCPNGPEGGPAWRGASRLAAADVERLVERLGLAGVPRRVPRVVANESLLADGPLLAVAVRAGRLTCSFDLLLRGAGFSGADASPLREVLISLVELAPVGQRGLVREAMGRALGERRAGRLAPVAQAIVPLGAGSSPNLRGWDLPRPGAWEPESF